VAPANSSRAPVAAEQEGPAPKAAPAAEPRSAAAKGTPGNKPAVKAAPAKKPTAKKTAPAKKPTAKETAPAPRPAPSPRTFVWVPVKGADAYEVQFFRGSRRVLLTRTSQPRLVLLTGRAGGPGRRFFLAPGAYRWYVWPLFRTASSVRRGDAVVQAKLVVPR
jgi:hypothetical protein